MDTLTADPVAPLLERLFAEAEATDATLIDDNELAGWDGEALRRHVEAEAADYAAVYRSMAGNFLAVSPEFGRLLYTLARSAGAWTVVEFGTSFGVSTIHLAAAVRDNGGGRVIGTELEPSKADAARANLAAAGLGDLVEIRLGDALDTLRTDLDGPIDMLLLDGAFTLYKPVLELLAARLRPGALVLAENALDPSGAYLDHVRDPRNGYLSLTLPFDPVRGNELSVRTRM